jgi:hypothetical protein
MDKVRIRRLTWWQRALNALMTPIMYFVAVCAGAWDERPQRTHRWNWQALDRRKVEKVLISGYMVEGRPDLHAGDRWLGKIPVFHLPFLPGGWKKYETLVPVNGYYKTWHVGWITDDGTIGVTRIPARGPVRVLLGRGGSRFFGLTPRGSQLKIGSIGTGSIGRHSANRHYPLY